MKQTIFYADTHAGSGKTHAAHKYIQKLDGRAAIATQINELSKQQRDDLAELGITARVISLDTVKECAKQFDQHCKDGRQTTPIANIKTVLQAYRTTKEVHLIIDELFSPVDKIDLIEEVSATHEYIADLFKTTRTTEFPGVLELVKNDKIIEVAEHSAKKKSSIQKHVRDLCKKVVSPHYRCLLSKKNFEDFQANIVDENETPEEKDSKSKLTAFTWMQPSILSGYKSVTIMGANFQTSKIKLYWGSMVNFVPHAEIKGIRYNDFSRLSHLIDIRPCSEIHLSGNFLDKKIGYQNFCDSVADAFAAEYGAVDHLVTMSAKHASTWKLEKGTPMSPNPMGLNGYMDRHYSIHLAPLFPSNDEVAMWEAVAGVTEEQLIIAQAYSTEYQSHTRSSIRNPECKEKRVFITKDRVSADHLCKIFGVEKSGKLLEIPALVNYTKPPRKTRSDKKPGDRAAKKAESQRLRRLADKMAAQATITLIAAE